MSQMITQAINIKQNFGFSCSICDPCASLLLIWKSASDE